MEKRNTFGMIQMKGARFVGRVAATARRGEQRHRGADDGRRAQFSVHPAILLVRPGATP